MEWFKVLVLSALALTVASDSHVEKCQSAGGQCKLLNEGCEGGSFRMGFCEPPAYRRCCIPWPDNADQCRTENGQCRRVSDGCNNGRFRVGLCPGDADNKCCVPYPSNDDRCTFIDGQCQPHTGHCSGQLRLGLCSGTVNACCVPQGGCNPDKDLNWALIEGDPNFNEDEFLGTWYRVRVYLPVASNISQISWDESATFFRKSDDLFVIANGRKKDADYCNDEIEYPLTRGGKGVLILEALLAKGVVVYYSKFFSVELICINPQPWGCSDHIVNFWSRYKKARPQDIARGEHIVKSHCYPYWKRMIDPVQNMDCVPPTKSKCDDNMGDKEEFEMGRMNCKKEKKERTCDPSKNNYRHLIPAANFHEKYLSGLYYKVRGYPHPSSYIGKELWDRTVFYYMKDEYKDLVFWDDNSRPIAEDTCNEEWTGNMTRLVPGSYEWRDVGERVVSHYAYIEEHFHVEIACYFKEGNTDSCDEVNPNFWSRTKTLSPKDLKKAIEVLDRLCFPDMQEFLIPKHEMVCDRQNLRYCEDDKPCEEAGGNCQYAKGGCFGGCFSKGMCGGPDDRQCCIPTPKKHEHRRYDRHDYDDDDDDDDDEEEDDYDRHERHHGPKY